MTGHSLQSVRPVMRGSFLSSKALGIEFVFFSLAWLLDAFITYYGLMRGLVREVNPLLSQLEPLDILSIKILGLFIMAGMGVWTYNHSPKFQEHCGRFWISTGFFLALVCAWNMGVISAKISFGVGT